MGPWEILTRSLGEFTLGWLLLSAVLGGAIGAAIKYMFEVQLPEQLKARRAAASNVHKYADPLLHAADEVEQRLDTLLVRGLQANWLSSDVISDVHSGRGFVSDPAGGTGYFFLSTLYVFARYFGWLEILRRKTVYLEYSATRQLRQFNGHLERINNAFRFTDIWELTSAQRQDVQDWTALHRHLQSALGETMIIDRDGELDCLSFREFTVKYVQPSETEFRFWFINLTKYFEGVSATAASSDTDVAGKQDFRRLRLILLQYAFYELIRFLDPKGVKVGRRPHSRADEILNRLPQAQRPAVNRLMPSVLGARRLGAGVASGERLRTRIARRLLSSAGRTAGRD